MGKNHRFISGKRGQLLKYLGIMIIGIVVLVIIMWYIKTDISDPLNYFKPGKMEETRRVQLQVQKENCEKYAADEFTNLDADLCVDRFDACLGDGLGNTADIDNDNMPDLCESNPETSKITRCKDFEAVDSGAIQCCTQDYVELYASAVGYIECEKVGLFG
ncbi:MAG: hypothetical protein QS98_C0006G0027 [archaeon GW2011_AR3]|nr:MAG: hypothetical protein QS98_C0006G0027 [archaeon GW2011_AR3]MBS3109212.1 hypothetical protein [Candidatus Woesearchaeota archaeon]